ncbi:MAG: UDP-N-acetylmuramoyl-L-alanyl-D-glutamate--2,6-diaminopimelate ligase, partial [Acidimicrobiales bacterium]
AGAVRVLGEGSTTITGIAMDSRAVLPGDLFACLPGLHVDGHHFAPAAVGAGAAALLSAHALDIAVPQVVAADVRRALGRLSDAFFGHPSHRLVVVGVTGTNGKTTTCAMLESIMQASGWPAAAIGTLTQALERRPGQAQPPTTPEAPDLQARLAELRDRGYRGVALEVSSHALDQHRVEGISFAAGVFTNLTQDHLDYHGTMDDYFEAKAALFEPGRVAVGVVNRDDPWGRVLVERLESAGQSVATFGWDDAEGLRLEAGGSSFVWQGMEVNVPIPGRFNVHNALGAAAAARSLGISAQAVRTWLGALDGVRGRFQRVDSGQSFTVLVDYAHTPDGLSQALAAGRELASGRLLVVFGAGGDRDQEKRAPMGEVAARLADLVVVTSDNPRSEDPDAIIAEVVAGARRASNLVVDSDRSRAIAVALANAEAGDVVIVAGKGHERTQEIAGRIRPFDDVAEVEAALARILGSRRTPGGGQQL